MLTRSKSAKLIYTVEIDFDEASREWNANKKCIGQMYVYTCNSVCLNGKICKRQVYRNSEKCFCHSK